MNRIIATLIAVTLLPLAGCAATHPADSKGRDTPFQDKSRIQWNSSKLKFSLDIDKVVADRTEAGLLRVRLVLRNKRKKDVFVDVRTLFTDGEGFEKERTNWEPICCTARTQTQYETVSLGSGVHDYQVIVREPKTFSGNQP